MHILEYHPYITNTDIQLQLQRCSAKICSTEYLINSGFIAVSIASSSCPSLSLPHSVCTATLLVCQSSLQLSFYSCNLRLRMSRATGPTKGNGLWEDTVNVTDKMNPWYHLVSFTFHHLSAGGFVVFQCAPPVVQPFISFHFTSFTIGTKCKYPTK